MKLGDVLIKTKFAKPQNIANMIVLPIVSNEEHTEVSEDMLFNISSDSDYSHLVLRNPESMHSIVPQGTSYINKQKAQDRAILSATVLKPEATKTVNVACIESDQGGHMETGTEEFTFIPSSIRAIAMEKDSGAGHSEYNILWEDVKDYFKKAGISSDRAHINEFYRQFDKELEEFAATFEPVKNQRGVIVFINNALVGIELYPNYKAWNKVWRNLIRHGYGSDALVSIRANKIAGYKPIINIDKVSSMEELENQVGNVIKHHLKFVKELVDPTLNEEVDATKVNKVDDFEINSVSTQGLKGQLVTKDNKILYFTAIKRII